MTIFNCENSASARAESTSIGSEAQPDKTKGYTKCEVVQWRTHAVQSYPQGVKVNTAVPGSILALSYATTVPNSFHLVSTQGGATQLAGRIA